MKLVITGGGTGGHVYPALVVAEELRNKGADLMYLGSLRGQEGKAAASRDIRFEGYPSAPLYSLKSLRGWKSLAALLRSQQMAKKRLIAESVDVVFSTGGYSAGPVVAAAKSLGIPYVIHEANSVPGRANTFLARKAHAFTCVFRCTEQYVPQIRVTRTGQPIRPELRRGASRPPEETAAAERPPTVLVLGGSQGSEFLNEMVPKAMLLPELKGVRVIHAAGPKNIDSMQRRLSEMGFGSRYDARDYLDTDEMVEAYRSATLVVARSGGTLAELALFRLPSVLVPLPTSADDHQLHNAEEFAVMDAATILRQESATAERMAVDIAGWIEDPDRRERAADQLRGWDCPDATQRIATIVEEAAGKSNHA